MGGDFFHPEICNLGLGGVHVDALYVDFHALNFVEKLEPPPIFSYRFPSLSVDKAVNRRL